MNIPRDRVPPPPAPPPAPVLPSRPRRGRLLLHRRFVVRLWDSAAGDSARPAPRACRGPGGPVIGLLALPVATSTITTDCRHEGYHRSPGGGFSLGVADLQRGSITPGRRSTGSSNRRWFAHFIRTERLRRCHTSSPALPPGDGPVGDIAVRWGFHDQAQFTRAFRVPRTAQPSELLHDVVRSGCPEDGPRSPGHVGRPPNGVVADGGRLVRPGR